MVFVSPEDGSHDLVAPLRRMGLPVTETKLEFADVEFVGRGVKGRQVLVGIECKRLSEITGDWDRLVGHQVLKMTPQYDHRWVVVEGAWETNSGGRLVRRSRWSGKPSPLKGVDNASIVRKRLLTLEMCGGVHVQMTRTRPETVAFLRDLYRWWTDEDEDEHKSHIVNYEPRGVIPLNEYQRGFAAWPGISVVRAKALAKHFDNAIRRACSASVAELSEIEVPSDDGRSVRRLGAAVASDLHRYLRGETK